MWKKTQKCNFRWQKVTTSEKIKLQNVNLGDKISQTSVKKTEKYKFRWQKSQHSVKRHKNVNLSEKKDTKM